MVGCADGDFAGACQPALAHAILVRPGVGDDAGAPRLDGHQRGAERAGDRDFATAAEIDLGEEGEEVFKQGISLIWKKQVVNRIYDKANQTLIYLSHSMQVKDGSAKMSISTIPLYGQEVVWTSGKPQ